jgi:hypothetical protein
MKQDTNQLLRKMGLNDKEMLAFRQLSLLVTMEYIVSVCN